MDRLDTPLRQLAPLVLACVVSACATETPESRADGSGGASGTGGMVPATGGAPAPATGGSAASGTGGIQDPSTGGAMPASGGVPASGGMVATGGMMSATGGSMGSAGSTSTCAPVTPGACSAPEVRITEIDVGTQVVVNENDADLKPLSISPIPSGGSRVAWMSSGGQIHVTTLDCDDAFVSDFSLPAMDYGDLHADDAGGVLLLTRDAQGGGTLNCGNPTNLCGTPPSPPIPCYDMYMVRFDGATETWATKLNTSSATLPPYSTGPTGPRVYFTWWYAHHGRLAFDGTNWAGYYGAAISVSERCTSGGNTAINIHQGDEMRVVGPTGELLSGRNSFDWGCSHSGFQKIVWDPGADRFVMTCRSDGFPNVGLNVNAQELVSAISPADSSVSNLVLSANAGSYWTLVSNMGTLHLLQYTSAGGTTADINLGAGTEPHLVKYGGSRLFAAWASGANMVGQVLDAATGATIGTQVPIAVPSNRFQDFRDYPDGSAAYPAPGSSAQKLKIVRILPCEG